MCGGGPRGAQATAAAGSERVARVLGGDERLRAAGPAGAGLRCALGRRRLGLDFRDLGLGLVDRMPGHKRFFIREAAGLTGEVPKLLRGEAL